MTEPKFYTPNSVTPDSTFTSSHGDDFIERICDWDRDSQFVSDGADDDATEFTLDIQFELGLALITRAILINHNLKDPTLEYWDGLTFQTFATGVALTDSNTIFTNAGLTTNRFRIRCSTTQVADAEKEIGELIICQQAIEVAQDFVSFMPTSRVEESQMKMADGSLHRAVFKHSVNRSEKYEANFSFNFLTANEVNSMRRFKESGVAFVVQPESVTRPDEIYYCHWIGPFKPKYMTTKKDAGFTIEMQVKEI